MHTWICNMYTWITWIHDVIHVYIYEKHELHKWIHELHYVIYEKHEFHIWIHEIHEKIHEYHVIHE